MDPKNINWKLVAAVLAALGYLAFKSGGLNKRMFSKLSTNGTVAAVLGIVTYFGWDFVMNRTRGGEIAHDYAMDVLPPHSIEAAQHDQYIQAQQAQQVQNLGAWGATAPVPQHRTGIAGPGGMETTIPLGC